MEDNMDRKINVEIASILKELLELDDLTPELIQRFMDCKYLIIIDMGCGNTSAALLLLDEYRESGDNSPLNYIHPIYWSYQDVDFDGELFTNTNDVSIPTVVGFGETNILVGPGALRTRSSCQNFKACPNEQNLNEVILQYAAFNRATISKRRGDVWSAYFYGILRKINDWCKSPDEAGRVWAPDLDLNSNAIVMVAHPAGPDWSDPSVLDSYKELAAQEDWFGKERVLTISEAKAAMQYVRRKGGIPHDFNKGVLIVDIGASTIDIEYLASDLDCPLEYSITMAGREADRLLAHYILETVFPGTMKDYPSKTDIPDESFFKNIGVKSSFFMYCVRMLKETVSNWANSPINVDGVQEIPLFGKDHTVRMTVPLLKDLLGERNNNPLTGAVAGDMSFAASYELPMALFVQKDATGYRAVQEVKATWYGHLENIIRYVLSSLKGSGRVPDQIIVTGGSCLLVGVRDHVRDAVRSVMDPVDGDGNLANNIVYLDAMTDYENAVPYGGACYVGGALKSIDDLVDFPEQLYLTMGTELISTVARKLFDNIKAEVEDIARGTFQWWAGLPDGDSSTSINGYKKEFSSRLSERLKGTENTNRLIKKTLEKLQPDELENTMQLIKGLLNNLAGTQYTGQPQFRDIEIDLSGVALPDFINDIDVYSLIHPIMNGFLIWLFGQDEEKRHSQGNRQKALNNFVNSNSNNSLVQDNLRKKIKKELENQFIDAQFYGIPDQIIRDLRKDITKALYTSGPGGVQN